MRHPRYQLLVLGVLLVTGRGTAADPVALDAFGDPLPKGAKARLGTARAAHIALGTAIPPDISRVIARDAVGAVAVVEAATSRLVSYAPDRYRDEPPSAISADATRVVSQSSRTLGVWEIASGRVVREVELTAPGVIPPRVWAALSGNGTTLAVVEKPSPRLSPPLRGGFGRNRPNTTPTRDGFKFEVAVYRVDTRLPPVRVPLLPGGAVPVLSGNGTILATYAGGIPSSGEQTKPTDEQIRAVRLWDTATGKELTTIRTTARTTEAVLSADGNTLVTSSEDGVAQLWDTRTGRAGHRLEGRPDGAWRMRFSADGKTLAGFGRSLAVRRWTVADGRLLDETKCPLARVSGQFNRPGSVSHAGGDRWVAHATMGSIGLVWEIPSGKLLTSVGEHTGGIRSLGLCAGGPEVITAGEDGRVVRWDGGRGKPTGPVPLPAATTPPPSILQRRVYVSADGTRLALHGDDGLEAVYDTATRAKLFTSPENVRRALLSPDFSTMGAFITEVDGKNAVVRFRAWDVYTGKQAADIEVGRGLEPRHWAENNAWFSPNGLKVAVDVSFGSDDTDSLFPGSDTRTLTVWDLSTEKRLGPVRKPLNAYVHAVAVSNDGVAIVSQSDRDYDRRTEQYQIWGQDLGRKRPGEVIDRFDRPAHRSLSHSWVDKITFAADGKRFAAAGPFGENREPGIRVYDWPSGRILQTFFGHSAPVSALVFSPDGKTLASGSRDTTVLIWDLTGLGK